MIKKIFILASICLLFVCQGFSSACDDEPQYYVVVAWEFGNQPTKAQPVISNVAYARCKYHSDKMVTNQFQTFYQAYHAKSRGQIGLDRLIAFAFDTRDQAEAKRRALIADK